MKRIVEYLRFDLIYIGGGIYPLAFEFVIGAISPELQQSRALFYLHASKDEFAIGGLYFNWFSWSRGIGTWWGN